MAQKSRSNNKANFQTGDIPNQSNYVDLIDSFAVLTNDTNSGSLTLSGSLITSGSINHNGSTVFGDSLTDTHTITGNITASGGISSSGTIVGNVGTFTSYTNANFGSANFSTTGTSTFTNITASGNISASGDVITSKTGLNEQYIEFNSNGIDISVDDGKAIKIDRNSGAVVVGNDIDFPSNQMLTVGGHISASGDIQSQGTIRSSGNLIATGSLSINGNTTVGNALSDTHTFNGHITASGNISASGNMDSQAFRAFSGQILSFKDSTNPIITRGTINGVETYIFGDSTTPNATQLTGTNIDLYGPVTASIISASGTITGLSGSFGNLAYGETKLSVSATELNFWEGLTSAEATQVKNISSNTISSTQWGYLGTMNQPVNSGAKVEFAGLTISQADTFTAAFNSGGLNINGSTKSFQLTITDVTTIQALSYATSIFTLTGNSRVLESSIIIGNSHNSSLIVDCFNVVSGGFQIMIRNPRSSSFTGGDLKINIRVL